jgi:hypothetical protein
MNLENLEKVGLWLEAGAPKMAFSMDCANIKRRVILET